MASKNAVPAISTLMGVQCLANTAAPAMTLKNFGFPEPYSNLSLFAVIEISATLLNYLAYLYFLQKGDVKTAAVAVPVTWLAVLCHMLFTSKVSSDLSSNVKMMIFPWVAYNAGLAIAASLGHEVSSMNISCYLTGTA